MSAFMVSKTHIDKLVALAAFGPRDHGEVRPDRAWSPVHWYASDPRVAIRAATTSEEYFANLHEIERRCDHSTADHVGAMLIAENVRSIEARYPDTIANPDDRPGPIDQSYVGAYSLPMTTTPPTALEGLNALSCYEYQACESNEWRDSEAYAFCDALRHALCGHLTRDVRGWDDWDRRAEGAA